MLFGIEAQMTLRIAMAQGAGGDHLGVEQGAVAEESVQIAAMAICPVHHGRYGGAPKRGIGKIHTAIIPPSPWPNLGTMKREFKTTHLWD
jgi:hypothetical protein